MTYTRAALSLALGSLVSLLAIILIFSQVDLEAFTRNIRAADPRYLLVMLSTYFVAMLVRGLRWQQLTRQPMRLGVSVHILNIGYLLNAVLPLRLGEVGRLLLVSQEPEQSTGAALSALGLERLLDLIFALLCVGLGLLLLAQRTALPGSTASTLGILILMALIGVVGVLFLPRTHHFLLRLAALLLRPFPQGLRESLLYFLRDTLENLVAATSPQRLLRSLFWSLVLWAVYSVYYTLGLRAFIADAPLGAGLLALGFVALGAAAPSLPGAVGVFQAAAVLALSTANYDTSLATSYAWVIWVLQISLILLTGIISLWAMGLSFMRLTREVQQQSAALAPGAPQQQPPYP